MECPYCSSDHIVPRAGHYRCMLCGEDFEWDPETDPDEYDVCREEGHDWEEIIMAGEWVAQCRTCGATDA